MTLEENNNMIQPALFFPDGSIQCDLVIFDLDGTIIDTGPGIKNCIGAAIKKMGLPHKTDKELEAFIGPPIRSAFRSFLHLTEEEAEEAIRAYRRFYYQSGIYEGEVYDGIPELLWGLKEKGYAVAVGTSKSWVIAHRVLRHFQLRSAVDGIFGSYLDSRLHSKAQVLQEALDHYTGKKLLPPGRLAWPQTNTEMNAVKTYPGAAAPDIHPNGLRAVMIGDRYYDVEGAAVFGIPTIGVTFGYGSAVELEEAGAALIAGHPNEIAARFPAKKG